MKRDRADSTNDWRDIACFITRQHKKKNSQDHIAKNNKEKDCRDFSIDGDLRPSASSSLLIMIPRRFSSRRRSFLLPPSPFHPFAFQYSGYCMNRDAADHLSSLFLPPSHPFFVFLARSFSSGYYETRFQRRRRRTRMRGKGRNDRRRRWKTSDVCPRGIVIFIGSQLFSTSSLCSLPLYVPPSIRAKS